MNWLNVIFLLATAFLAVFFESWFDGVRRLLGAQVDLLPSLMAYASLSAGWTAVCLLAVLGGLWFDALSANPLGISVLPLLLTGVCIYASRELLLRTQLLARSAVGLAASAAVPLLTLLLLLTMGHSPLLGWYSLWQWSVMSIAGAVATPACFVFFDWLERMLVHGRAVETSFRPDREIRRGR